MLLDNSKKFILREQNGYNVIRESSLSNEKVENNSEESTGNISDDEMCLKNLFDEQRKHPKEDYKDCSFFNTPNMCEDDIVC